MKTFSQILISHPTLGRLYLTKKLTDAQIKQLIYFSNHDPKISNFTSDATNRFKDYSMFLKWKAKDRLTYILEDNAGNLLGIIWFGEKKPETNFTQQFDFSLYPFTFSMRIYAEARGQGLGKVFFDKAFNDFKQSDRYRFSQNKGIWLITSENNTPAIHLYQNLNFTQATKPDQNKIIMIRKD